MNAIEQQIAADAALVKLGQEISRRRAEEAQAKVRRIAGVSDTPPGEKQYRGTTYLRASGEWKAQMASMGIPYIGRYETEREAAKEWDALAYLINQHLPEPKRFTLNFPDDYYSGEHSPPEPSDRVSELYHLWKTRNRNLKLGQLLSVERDFTVHHLKQRLGSERAAIAKLKEILAESYTRADETATLLYNFGEHELFEAWKKEREQQ